MMLYEQTKRIDEFMLSILILGFKVLEEIGYTVYHYYAQNDDSVSIFLLRFHGKPLGVPIIGRAHDLVRGLDYAYTAATFHNFLNRGHTEDHIKTKLGWDDDELERRYKWLRGRKDFK